MTRAEKYRALNDEELARLCVELSERQEFCRYLKKCDDAMNGDQLIPAEWCVECALLWLREEVNDETDRTSEDR